MKTRRLLFLTILSCCSLCTWADSEVHVETAGTLESLLPTSDRKLKVTGVINGTDIKYIRSLVTAGKVTSLDWSEVSIVAGADAYYESNTTANNVIGKEMFLNCSRLQAIILPATITSIQDQAFAKTGIKAVDIPNSVTTVGFDAFAYCSSLETVVIGSKVRQLNQGVFYSTPVKTAYVKPVTPPSIALYLFSSNPKIYVYTEALDDYKGSSWNGFGTLYGGLEATYPMEADPNTYVKTLCGIFFEDAACTQLKAEFQSMSDEDLQSRIKEEAERLSGSPQPSLFTATALKVKNGSWAAYEQDFRIHSYKAYSDANYWNSKMMSSGGSYMGNPTGIYTRSDEDELYVFVDADVPNDASLYLAGCVDNQLVTNAQTGKKLVKGLNIVSGAKDALYYVIYTADTKSMTKTLSEWPEMKIHIEGGAVNGYYDVSRHSDSDYKALLSKATLKRFTVRGGHSLYHLKTASFKSVFPRSIDKSIAWFDSIAVWQKDLMGMTESVASGQKAGAPWFLTGGEAIYPLYYNNPNFAIEGEESDAGYANSTAYRTSYNGINCIKNCLDATNPEMDDWCAGHECGHNNQKAITVEGGTEVSNNLFSNFGLYLGGLNSSRGSTLATVMKEFGNHEAFYFRDVSSQLRMYWNLYLYYHLGQKNTSFYPELFKALREDPLSIYEANNNNGGLKFVRKVCEVAQEDLTDFFNIWGFFEPMTNRYLECYGDHYITVTKNGINSTKAKLRRYEKKNREIIFVEDRADYVLTNGFLTPAGNRRRGSDQVGQSGDVGQFTSYLPGGCQPSSYSYLQADSLFALKGSGGLGFLILDDDDNLLYAANAKNFCAPNSILHSSLFTLRSLDADGTLHEVPKAGEGEEHVALTAAGQLATSMDQETIKLILSGRINGTDIKHMRHLSTDGNLAVIDLSQAQVTSGGDAYYTQDGSNYRSSVNAIGDYAFHRLTKLISLQLPKSITKIGVNACSQSGVRIADIPDRVTSVGGDAFAYCSDLTTVIVGAKVKTMSQGVFYSSPVKEAYVKPLTPPSIASYLFSSKPTIHVYASALDDYKASPWAEYGTLVGDLDECDIITDIDAPAMDEEMVNGKMVNGKYYDLFGRQVTHLQRGTLYLRNGKKFMMK